MRDYTALLEAGNKAQLEKLRKNGHKKSFDMMDIMELFELLDIERLELDQEIYRMSTYNGNIVKCFRANIDLTKIRHEAADIANFAHMIILACDKELSK